MIISGLIISVNDKGVYGMGYYELKQVAPWLYSIYDPMSVFCYLAVGSEKALLYDTVFGVGDLHEVIREITDKPVTVALGHGHIDHANGAHQFESAYLHDNDLTLFGIHTSKEYRTNIINNLKEGGIETPAGFDSQSYIDAAACKLLSMKEGMSFELGGLRGEVVEMAGHTAGSVGLLFRDKRTLLVSDAANAHVWMFLEESLPISEYIKMLDRVYDMDFQTFYTGHGNEPQPKSMLQKYKKVAAEASLDKAVPYEQLKALKPYFYEEDGVGIVFSERTLR